MGMTFGAWLRYGIEEGYCTSNYCANHDLYAPEDGELFAQLADEYDGMDFCWPTIRLRTLAEDI